MRFTRSIELYPHQEEAVQWMFECSEQEPFGGILAHDMGLGKTIDILYFIANQDEDMIGSNLIVVPSNLIRQWADEFANYVEDIDNYDLAVYTTRAKPKNIHKFRVVLTTYDTLISDHKKGNESIFGISWNRIFLDEAHEIRNSKTIRNRVIMRLEGESKWCMTGTPIWNCKDDLDSLKRFISPERPSLVTRDLIHIRTKEILVLPKYNHHDCECHFNRFQYESYKRLEKRILRQSLVGEAKKRLLGNIIRLRRLCNHTEGEESSEQNISDWGKNSKFKKVNEILRKVPDGEKIVIFSSWLTSLLCIKKNLKELGYNKISMFHGELSMEDRQKELKKFRDGDNNILLITVKCGGVGLNLVCANHIIIFEPQYSPFAEKQAIDRVYRIGQQKEVFVYRLYMKSTIENWMNSIKDWKSVVKRIQLDGSSESEEGALESKIKAFQTYVTLDEKLKKLMEEQELKQKELETKVDAEDKFEIL